MLTREEFQRLVSLKGPAVGGTDDQYQSCPLWLDCGQVSTAAFEPEMFGQTNCQLKLQTAMWEGGPWTDVALLSTRTVATLVRDEMQTAILQRYVRWVVHPTAAGWSITFRIGYSI